MQSQPSQLPQVNRSLAVTQLSTLSACTSLSPLPLCSLEEQSSNNTRRHSQSSNNRHPDQALFRDLILDQLAQALCLQVPRLDVQQTVVVTLRLGVVAQFVVSQREVVETFSSAVRALAEYVGEKTYAFLLFDAGRGFYEALCVVSVWKM